MSNKLSILFSVWLFWGISYPLPVFGDDALLAAQTNLVIESEESDISLGWTRQAILGNKNGIVDRSGQVVAYADVAVQRSLATNIQHISNIVLSAVTNSLNALWDVTNQVPNNAHHISLYLPPKGVQNNLTGEVVAEGTDGVTDWQVVKYSQYLAIAPNRHITYKYLDTVAIVKCEWDKPWSKTNLEHRCTFSRPTLLQNKLIRSYTHDRIGGDQGFDFGSAVVTVDGVPTFTGTWTNQLDGSIHCFKNGTKIQSLENKNE